MNCARHGVRARHALRPLPRPHADRTRGRPGRPLSQHGLSLSDLALLRELHLTAGGRLQPVRARREARHHRIRHRAAGRAARAARASSIASANERSEPRAGRAHRDRQRDSSTTRLPHGGGGGRAAFAPGGRRRTASGSPSCSRPHAANVTPAADPERCRRRGLPVGRPRPQACLEALALRTSLSEPTWSTSISSPSRVVTIASGSNCRSATSRASSSRCTSRTRTLQATLK